MLIRNRVYFERIAEFVTTKFFYRFCNGFLSGRSFETRESVKRLTLVTRRTSAISIAPAIVFPFSRFSSFSPEDAYIRYVCFAVERKYREASEIGARESRMIVLAIKFHERKLDRPRSILFARATDARCARGRELRDSNWGILKSERDTSATLPRDASAFNARVKSQCVWECVCVYVSA